MTRAALLPSALPITPIDHPLRASVAVPGSKSLTNRALAAAALADGTTRLTHALFSDDTQHFANGLRQLGFAVETHPAQSDEDSNAIAVHGLGGRIPATHAELFTGNAGTAARFLTALAALGRGEFVIDGDERMRQRPIGDLLEALNLLGANARSATGCPPVRVIASGLRGGSARVAGDTSSQFLSALLLAAPRARSPVEIAVERGLSSKPYVDMTIAVMADFGVTVERSGYERFRVEPQPYRARETYPIECDASAASYFFAAPAICGGIVSVENISCETRQGDIAFLDALRQMGCAITHAEGRIEVSGPGAGELQGIDIDMSGIPDTAQTLAAIAPFANSPTAIRGIASARLKETDRIAATCAELRRLGVTVDERADGMTIYPCAHIRPAAVHTYNDHRMAMAFALIGLRAEGVVIENPACVSKTFPGYFAVLESLR